jgi:hypothetical protein
MTALQLKALDGEILPPGASVRVIGRTHPLSGGRVELELEAGLSIAEILEALRRRSYRRAVSSSISAAIRLRRKITGGSASSLARS